MVAYAAADRYAPSSECIMMLPAQARVVIIANNHAGQAHRLALVLTYAMTYWRERGWHVDHWLVTYPGHAEALARQAVQQQYDMVVAAGGDGTVNEVANGLIGSHVVLAPLPIGTVNVWAREAGFSMDPREAARQICLGTIGTMDLGVLDGQRHFILMTGVGFDADVVKHLYSHDKKRFGVFAYIWRIFQVVWVFRGVDVTIVLDEEELSVRALMMVIGNTPWYASFIPFTPKATVDDGLLDVCLISGNTMVHGPWQFIGLYLKLYFGWHDPSIVYRRVQRVQIRGGALPVQIDGDYVGMTPAEIGVVPHALRVLVTPQVAERLFTTTSKVGRA